MRLDTVTKTKTIQVVEQSFAIASATLAPVAARRMRGAEWRAGTALGALLALGYALQTAGLERTTVSSAGFITGLYVVFTPLFAFALFRLGAGRWVWAGVALSLAGLGLLSGVGVGDPLGDLLVLLGSAAYSLQIALLERYARVVDPIAFTLVEMLVSARRPTVLEEVLRPTVIEALDNAIAAAELRDAVLATSRNRN